MNADEYARYLRSPQWKHMRALAHEHYGSRCILCGSMDTTLDVHHRTYARLGCERLADLTILCRGCHSSYHQPPPPLDDDEPPMEGLPWIEIWSRTILPMVAEKDAEMAHVLKQVVGIGQSDEMLNAQFPAGLWGHARLASKRGATIVEGIIEDLTGEQFDVYFTVASS